MKIAYDPISKCISWNPAFKLHPHAKYSYDLYLEVQHICMRFMPQKCLQYFELLLCKNNSQ